MTVARTDDNFYYNLFIGQKMNNNKVPASYYEKGIKENIFQRIWHRKRCKEILRLIPPQKLIYLDVGCNGGWLMNKVVEKLNPRKVYGLDISEQSIDYCRKKYPSYHFQVDDCSNLPFKDNFFDLITCFEVLEHIYNPKKAVLEMKRCLKKEGELIILIPTDSLIFRIIWYFWTRLGRGYVWRDLHINKISADDLEEFLKSIDFEIIKTKKFQLGMLKVIKAKRKK